jgi:aminoglycoside phosphotransferase (APT) family kinase protein
VTNTFALAGVDESILDSDALALWMDSVGLPGGEFEKIALLAGGTQNILIRFTRGGAEYVLRRPPRHLRPKSNDALRREVRILTALCDTDVPAPRLIAACLDETVLDGAVFYLMTPVDGFNPVMALPELHAGSAPIRREMGLEAARGIARLSTVDHVSVGLGDLDRSTGFLDRQVGRWLRELDSYRTLAGYAGDNLPGIEESARWLDKYRPQSWRAGILHGDYHLANLMFSPEGPNLAAIVDWEMWTIGDPLLDLGWLIATWPTRPGPSAVGGALAEAGGLGPATDLVDAYSQLSDRDLSSITWYIVLASFKLGILLEGTYARSCAGLASEEIGRTMHLRALDLFAQATMWIKAS